MVIKQQTVDIFSLPTVGVTKLKQSYNTMKVNVQFITQGTKIHMLPLLRDFVLKIKLTSWVFLHLYLQKP